MPSAPRPPASRITESAASDQFSEPYDPPRFAHRKGRAPRSRATAKNMAGRLRQLA